MQIAVSFLKSQFDQRKTLQMIERTSANYIHVDIMDGKFVNNKTLQLEEIVENLKYNKKALDVHLMVSDPSLYLEELSMLNNIEYVTFHYEAVDNIDAVISLIKSYKFKVGISIKPNTIVEKLEGFLDKIDQVLVMSVEPGAGGQDFIPASLDKIEKLKYLREKNHYSYKISVDGGINEQTAKLCQEAGVDILAIGSYVCMSDDYEQQIDSLRNPN